MYFFTSYNFYREHFSRTTIFIEIKWKKIVGFFSFLSSFDLEDLIRVNSYGHIRN